MSVTHSLSHFDLTKALPESWGLEYCCWSTAAGVLLLGVLGGCPSNSLLASHHLKACLTSVTKIKVPKPWANLAGCKCRVGNRSVVFWLSCWSPVYLSWQEWLTRPVSAASANKSPTSFFLGWAPFFNCVWESQQIFGPKHITVQRALLHQTSFLISWKLSSSNENLGLSYSSPCSSVLAIRRDAGSQHSEAGSPAPRGERGTVQDALSWQGRFLSACFQRQPAVVSVCHPLGGTREQSSPPAALAHGHAVLPKLCPPQGQLLGKSLESGQWLHTEIHLLTRTPMLLLCKPN